MNPFQKFILGTGTEKRLSFSPQCVLYFEIPYSRDFLISCHLHSPITAFYARRLRPVWLWCVETSCVAVFWAVAETVSDVEGRSCPPSVVHWLMLKEWSKADDQLTSQPEASYPQMYQIIIAASCDQVSVKGRSEPWRTILNAFTFSLHFYSNNT